MDYHADRFQDSSVMVWRDAELIAVLPASRAGEVVTSHAGLTYGGLVWAPSLRTDDVLEVVRAVVDHLASEGVRSSCGVRFPAITKAPGRTPTYMPCFASGPF